MEASLIQSKSRLGLHLEGDNEIKAALLADTIKDIAELTELAAKIEAPEAYFQMNVTAFQNGSFIIDFSTVCLTNPNLLFNALALASNVIGIVKGFFEIKKLLKGKKPESVVKVEGDKIQVQNEDGQSVIVKEASGTIINNTRIDHLTVNITNNIHQHNPSGGFSIKTEDGDSKYSSDDVKNMYLPLPREETICKLTTEDTQLLIKKADLIGHSTWDFRYKRHLITARIDDDGWLEKINNGNISLTAGDYINVTLEISIDIDENNNPIPETEKYRVIKVHGDIQHNYAEQTVLG